MKKINYIDSIRHPIITEKATILSEQNKTVFKVHEKATKIIIKINISLVKKFLINSSWLLLKFNLTYFANKFNIINDYCLAILRW